VGVSASVVVVLLVVCCCAVVVLAVVLCSSVVSFNFCPSCSTYFAGVCLRVVVVFGTCVGTCD